MKYGMFIFLIIFISCNDTKQQQRNLVIDQVKAEDSLVSLKNQQELESLKSARSIAIIAAEDADLSNYSLILQKGDLAATLLKGKGPYTVFAPINDGFKEREINDFDEAKAATFSKLFMLNRSLPYDYLKNEIEKNNNELLIENMEGSRLKFFSENDEIYVLGNHQNIIKINKPEKASNGYLYRISEIASRN